MSNIFICSIRRKLMICWHWNALNWCKRYYPICTAHCAGKSVCFS